MRLLRASDEFCIDRIKTQCEERLCNCVTKENVHEVYAEAERFRAQTLSRYCEWVLRQSRADEETEGGGEGSPGGGLPDLEALPSKD